MELKTFTGILSFDEQCRMDAKLDVLLPIEQLPTFIRASGDVICTICSKNYYSHPRLIPYYFLHLICDGLVVKL